MRSLLVFLLLSAGVWGDPQVESIFAKVRRMNPGLKDCTAALDVKMDTQFGPLDDHPRLSGKYLFKKEDKHQIQLPKAPSYLKRHARIFGFSLPDLARYNSQVLEETPQQWKIQLVPKVKDPNTDRVEILVDKASSTCPQFDTFYQQDGHLTVRMKYMQTQGYTVLESAVADVRLPSILLTSRAEIRYSNYAFNVGLNDALFAPDPKRR